MTALRRLPDDAQGTSPPGGFTVRAGSEPRNFLQCCVLLLLRERPAHGYELLERLKSFGIADGDPGNIYRRLRSLETQGMVRSKWEASGAGPRRRTYYLTARGDVRLRGWADSLAETRRLLDYYLGRHARVVASPAQADPSVSAERARPAAHTVPERRRP